MECPLSPKFKMPSIEPYDGSKDPVDHLDMYNSVMHRHAVPNEIKCRAFSITLKGPARAWFNKIRLRTIENFKQLSNQFVPYFIGRLQRRKPPTHLLTVKQRKEESLREYINRFNGEVLEVEEADKRISLMAFMSGLKPGRFAFSLAKKPLISMANLMSRAQKHMNAKDVMKS